MGGAIPRRGTWNIAITYLWCRKPLSFCPNFCKNLKKTGSAANVMIKLISLYFFSLNGIILWDKYDTYDGCMADKARFEAKFAHLREETKNSFFVAECLEIGMTTENFLKKHGVIEDE